MPSLLDGEVSAGGNFTALPFADLDETSLSSNLSKKSGSSLKDPTIHGYNTKTSPREIGGVEAVEAAEPLTSLSDPRAYTTSKAQSNPNVTQTLHTAVGENSTITAGVTISGAAALAGIFPATPAQFPAPSTAESSPIDATILTSGASVTVTLGNNVLLDQPAGAGLDSLGSLVDGQEKTTECHGTETNLFKSTLCSTIPEKQSTETGGPLDKHQTPSENVKNHDLLSGGVPPPGRGFPPTPPGGPSPESISVIRKLDVNRDMSSLVVDGLQCHSGDRDCNAYQPLHLVAEKQVEEGGSTCALSQPVPLEALAVVACDAFSSLFCVPRESVKSEVNPTPIVGSHSVFYVVQLSLSPRQLPFESVDQKRWIFRLPLLGSVVGQDEGSWLESDICAMKFIKSRVGLPMPGIYGHHSGTDNKIGAPYLLMDFIEGQKLEDVWESWDETKRLNCLEQCAGYVRKLGRFGFDKIGVLGSEPRKGYFVQGIPSNIGGTATLNGPYKSTDTYLNKIWQEKVASLGAWGSPEAWKARQDLVFLKLLIPALISSEPSNSVFYLSLPEFDGRNILVDHKGAIKGIIGWKRLQVMPKEMGYAQYPAWISRDFPIEHNGTLMAQIPSTKRTGIAASGEGLTVDYNLPSNPQKQSSLNPPQPAATQGLAGHLENINSKRRKTKGGAGGIGKRSRKMPHRYEFPYSIKEEDKTRARAASMWNALPDSIEKSEAAKRGGRKAWLAKEESTTNPGAPTFERQLSMVETFKEVAAEQGGERKQLNTTTSGNATDSGDIARYRRIYHDIFVNASPQDKGAIESSIIFTAVHAALTDDALRPHLAVKLAKHVLRGKASGVIPRTVRSGGWARSLLGMIGGRVWAKSLLEPELKESGSIIMKDFEGFLESLESDSRGNGWVTLTQRTASSLAFATFLTAVLGVLLILTRISGLGECHLCPGAHGVPRLTCSINRLGLQAYEKGFRVGFKLFKDGTHALAASFMSDIPLSVSYIGLYLLFPVALFHFLKLEFGGGTKSFYQGLNQRLG